MLHRPVMAWFAPMFLLLFVAGPAAAQTIGGLATSTSLTRADKEQIESYARQWTEDLRDAADDPETIRDIRTALLDPVVRGGVTEVFRDQYSRASLETLDGIVKQGNPHVSVNALIVMSKLGTDRALDRLVEYTSIRDEDRMHVRLAAARGCAVAFKDGDLASTMPKKIATASRRLTAAAKSETDPRALQHQIRAVFEASRIAELPQGSQDQIRLYLVEAIHDVADRAAASEDAVAPGAMLTAVYPIIVHMRTEFLKLSDDSQRAQVFGRELGPCLRQILEVATVHWSALRERPDAANIISFCEKFLRFVDPVVRGGGNPPNSRLKDSFESGDIAGYQRDLKEWNAVLKTY